MIKREQIQRLNPINITLLSIIPYQLITLVILITYSVQGLIAVSKGSANAYYGYYISADADGSLTMDLANIILLIAGMLVIILAIRKKQSRFLILAVVLFAVPMLCTQSIENYVISIILCFFGYPHLKKYPSGLSEMQHEKYIPTALFLCYSVEAILAIFQLIGHFGDLIINNKASEFDTIPDGYEGEDASEWLWWGTNAGSTDISFINQIAPMLIYLLILAAVIIMYFGLRRENCQLYRLAASAYLLYIVPFFIIYISMFQLYELVIFLVLPQTILSIWILVFVGHEKVKTNLDQSHKSEQIKGQ